MSKILREIRETEAARQQLRQELRLIRGGQARTRPARSTVKPNVFRQLDRSPGRLNQPGEAESNIFTIDRTKQHMEEQMSPTEEYAQKILEKLRNCENLTSLSRDYRDALTAVETFRSLAECNRRRAEEYGELVQVLEKEISELLTRPVAAQGE